MAEAAKYEKNAMIFKAFCDSTRLRILEMLQSGEKCACKLLENLEISQPTLSHHMKILCDSGIIASRKEGKWTHYRISEEGRRQVERLLHNLVTVSSQVEFEMEEKRDSVCGCGCDGKSSKADCGCGCGCGGSC